jgi:hypothetical protein
MDFPLCSSGVHKISLVGTGGLSLENKAITCLSLVPVWRISTVLKMPVKDVLSTYPEHGCKLLLYVTTASSHCVISQKTAVFIHHHHCENPRSHYCTCLSSFWCLHCLVLWEETTSTFYFNITGVCLMCLNRLFSPSGRIIKSWISNRLPCKTEKSVYLICILFVDSLMWSKWTHFDINPTQCQLDLYKNKVIISIARVCSCNAHTK